LTEWKDSGEDAVLDHYKISSIAGGLAVLVIQHREWLQETSGNRKMVFIDAARTKTR